MATDWLLETQGLVKRFGGVAAIDGLDFHIQRGEILGVIGPNGSGKTTLFNVVSGFLKANSGRRVALEGHTDERGGREYNLALGQRRAEAVRRALALLGVGDNQMEAVSFGKEKPAMPGSDEQAWAQNRRVEIVYR